MLAEEWQVKHSLKKFVNEVCIRVGKKKIVKVFSRRS